MHECVTKASAISPIDRFEKFQKIIGRRVFHDYLPVLDFKYYQIQILVEICNKDKLVAKA